MAASTSLEQLYKTCFPVIRAKCGRMLDSRAEAEDVAQEVFARLLDSPLAARLDGPPELTLLAWVYRASTRLAIDRMRAQRRQGALLLSADLGPFPAANAEVSLVARRAIAALATQTPADELEVAILSRLDLLSQLEIAALTKTSERSIRRLLHRFDERVAVLRKEMPI